MRKEIVAIVGHFIIRHFNNMGGQLSAEREHFYAVWQLIISDCSDRDFFSTYYNNFTVECCGKFDWI